MLRLNKVSYCWPKTVTPCLAELSLSLNKSEWLAIVGDNGSGKSTLLRIMAGLLMPTEGDVELNQQRLIHINTVNRAKSMGVLFQASEYPFFHHTVAKEVGFGLKQRNYSKQEITHSVAKILALCGLTEVAELNPLKLNAAQKRMVTLASISITTPDILLLDEPTRDFDAHWLTYFENWLAAQKQLGTTICIVSHDFDFIARHFNRVVYLAAGKIAADGLPEHVLMNTTLQSLADLPAPTLYNLSKKLGLPIKNTPQEWAEMLISQISNH